MKMMSSSVQTRKKMIPKIMLQKFKIFQNNNPISNYFFNTLKNRELIAQYNKNLKNNTNIIKNNSVFLNISSVKRKKRKKPKENKKEEILPKLPPYTFKYFCNESIKNSLRNSLSFRRVKSIEKDKSNLESNFMRLKKDSNIYTSNADYIKNKKLVIIDKYSYDNNKYMPDRLGLFDMLELRRPKKQKGKGIFGKIYYSHNKYHKEKEDLNKKMNFAFYKS